MKKEEADYRVRRVQLRMTSDEYQKMRTEAAKYSGGNLSRFVVYAGLERPLTFVYVDENTQRIMDYVKSIRKTYYNIGINYNQVVKRINSIRTTPDIISSLAALDSKSEKLIILTEAMEKAFKAYTKEYDRLIRRTEEMRKAFNKYVKDKTGTEKEMVNRKEFMAEWRRWIADYDNNKDDDGNQDK